MTLQKQHRSTETYVINGNHFGEFIFYWFTNFFVHTWLYTTTIIKYKYNCKKTHVKIHLPISSLCFSVGQKKRSEETLTQVIKWCQRACWSPPQTSHPEHTGKVSVREKVDQSSIHSHPLVLLVVIQTCTPFNWLHSLSFIVPSRQAAAV